MARSRRRERGSGEGDLRAGAAVIPSTVGDTRRSFDEWCGQFTLTDAERRELVYFLAAFRYRRTIETLM